MSLVSFLFWNLQMHGKPANDGSKMIIILHKIICSNSFPSNSYILQTLPNNMDLSNTAARNVVVISRQTQTQTYTQTHTQTHTRND